MTKQEIAELKSDLKREILNELTKEDYVKDNTSKKLKDEFWQMLYSKGYKDNYERSKIWAGMCTMLRFAMGYRSVSIIPSEKYVEAKAILFKLLNLLPKIDKEEDLWKNG